MIIHKCDRCGKIVDDFDKLIFPTKHAYPSCTSIELCEDCYNDFQQWIDDGAAGIEILNDTLVDLIKTSKDPITQWDINENHWQTVTDKTERNGG